MKYVYTKHAEDKLREYEAKLFKISKRKLESVIYKPKSTRNIKKVLRVIGALDTEHSLCVVYKVEQKTIKIITFFPTKKGRYEN